jgi:hypothetical protein
MKKAVIPISVLFALLLLGSTSLAVGPEKLWWTEFTSDVFTWPEEGSYAYDIGGMGFTVVVDREAPGYQGIVLLRHIEILARTDEPGLNCAETDPYIQPGQPVRFHIGWRADEEMTHQDAEASFDSLSFTVTLQDQTVPLERQGTYPYREAIDWDDEFCIWTIRP